MAYLDLINQLLTPKITEKTLVLDLFAGCGGLALGFEAAGFETLGFEMNPDAANTYRANLKGDCRTEKLTLDTEYPAADIVIGGPPCQPFSVGGNQNGIHDSRNGFPFFVDAIRKVKPRMFLFENVRGLLYSNKWYLELIIEELESLGYKTNCRLLNAVHYGVPQNRERLFLVGHNSEFSFPAPELKKYTAGEAIFDLMNTVPQESKFLTEAQDIYIAKYEKASKCINPRDIYADRPSRTLTCRNLSGATGDMHRVKLPDGRRRRLLLREAARLQSFPDHFIFTGAETNQFNQIGNAVPPMLAYKMAQAVKECYCKEKPSQFAA
ncbi:DNA cytosine methyltransferase [Mucilaginibacter gossypii]|uniref:DNA cytosine methyltransferase n=1 Tax=Mucilaginibacter gossypii TaxID=551996 RepID=UPI000DCBDE74|nr:MULTISPECIES: DNA cytosine methyltransferase [Mucilaginibacter]QTE35807.1 DNA cytosine methyltransferase [Mucilaginibacter gossypii]RAV56836.1 DNA (cytosine-5-)-methyltransferase [Mucilaginibacter rubeus]